MQTLFYLFGCVVLIFVIWQLVRILYYSRVSGQLTKEAEPLDHHPKNADRRIVIIGDSLWAGVGAEDQGESLAGRLIADLPEALVVNKAESGAQIADGFDQIKAAIEEHGEFDQIIIQLGANDILHLSNQRQAEDDLRELLEMVKSNAPDVAYMVSGSIGFVPLFLLLLDWFYTYKSRQYVSKFSKVARDVGVQYIDLYYTRENDPFYQQPDKFYAADLFHPSGAGYGIWYGICRNNLQCFDYNV